MRLLVGVVVVVEFVNDINLTTTTTTTTSDLTRV